MKTMLTMQGLMLGVVVMVCLISLMGCDSSDIVNTLSAIPTAVNDQITDAVTKAIH
jgi:uncharacterized lipoprotein YehR (DUF1307 family)